MDSRSRPAAVDDATSASLGSRIAAPAIVALVTFVTFLPCLRDGFVAWDDDKNFLNNPHYRGLGSQQLHWMWTTFHLGHYVPLTWMTLGFDYAVWGMNPFGYHLTNVVLHAANAVLLYFVARQLLPRALPALDDRTCVLSATVAALLFAVHPLRVESVAWVTERRDVLSGFFYLASLAGYLRAVDQPPALDRKWYTASIIAFACALLSKATALTLPAALLVLDIYPLRRFRKRVAAELAPFGVLAVATGVLSIVALHPPAQLSLSQKIAVSAYGLVFYLRKTLLPDGLSPLYELPQQVQPWAPRYLASYVIVLALVAAAWYARRRASAVVAAFAAFVIAVLPMLGIVQNGPQIAADRYTYFAAQWLALFAGGCFGWWLLSPSRATRGTSLVFGGAVILTLAARTWRQSYVWHDTPSLWTRVLELDENSSIAHVGMATLLLGENRVAEGAEQAERAVAIAPRYSQAHNDLGVAYARSGDAASAIKEYETAIQLEPGYDEPHSNLGMLLATRGDVPGAIAQYRAAIALNPDASNAHVNWGNAMVRAGRPDDAIGHYREAIVIRPDNADAELNWGVALAVERHFTEAVDHFRRALAIDPQSQEARVYLARATQLGGR